VVEALSSGLPIVTTDVGGIRDYGGGSVFPVLANNDDDGMVAAVIRYLDDSSLRDDVGRRGRQFAEDQLAWPLIAEQHIEAYRQLLQT
jgi:glycosyltransferase involved in cell wall biosynthesis